MVFKPELYEFDYIVDSIIKKYKRVLIRVNQHNQDYYIKNCKAYNIPFDLSYLHLVGEAEPIKRALFELNSINSYHNELSFTRIDNMSDIDIITIQSMQFKAGLTPLPENFYHDESINQFSILVRDCSNSIVGVSTVLLVKNDTTHPVAMVIATCIEKRLEGIGLGLKLMYETNRIVLSNYSTIWGIVNENDIHVLNQLALFNITPSENAKWMFVEL